MKYPRKKSKAFGLIETLVACAILIVITGALLAINVMIMADITFSKNRAAAFNLAQEAIESARQIRDTNLIDSDQKTNWDTFVCDQSTAPNLKRPSTSAAKQYYTVSAGRFSACYGGNFRIALIPDQTGKGEDIPVDVTTFNRLVYFETSGVSPQVGSSAAVTEANAIRIVAQVNWVENGKNRQIEVKELLTNWKPGY